MILNNRFMKKLMEIRLKLGFFIIIFLIFSNFSCDSNVSEKKLSDSDVVKEQGLNESENSNDLDLGEGESADIDMDYKKDPVFRSHWNIDEQNGYDWEEGEEYSTAMDYVRLPLVKNGTYDFIVKWGDGLQDSIKNWDDKEKLHIYSVPGVYEVEITGVFEGWKVDSELGMGAYCNLMEISNWGTMAFGDTSEQFYECDDLKITAKDAPDLRETKSLQSAFAECWNVSGSAYWNTWDVSNIESMVNMFSGTRFNGDISNWDVSKTTKMNGMFMSSDFNGDVSNWDVSNVEMMDMMFFGSEFNGNISRWNVRKVNSMSRMFERSKFKDDISNWDVSSAKNMERMFSGVELPTDIYDSMLIKWSELQLQQDVVLDIFRTKYSSDAVKAREKIINDFNWTINDAGLEE